MFYGKYHIEVGGSMLVVYLFYLRRKYSGSIENHHGFVSTFWYSIVTALEHTMGETNNNNQKQLSFCFAF